MKNFTQHIRIERKKQMTYAVVPIALAMFVVAGLIFWGTGLNPVISILFTTALLFVGWVLNQTAHLYINHYGKLIDRTIRGEKAEKSVEALLNTLPKDQYLVVHDIDLGTHNIDHLVLSTHGQITIIETKSHGGKITHRDGQILCNGKSVEKDFIQQTLSHVFQTRERVMYYAKQDIWINGIICFPNALVDIRQPIKGIKITYKKALLSEIQKARPNPETLHNWMWENRQLLTLF